MSSIYIELDGRSRGERGGARPAGVFAVTVEMEPIGPWGVGSLSSSPSAFAAVIEPVTVIYLKVTDEIIKEHTRHREFSWIVVCMTIQR